MSINLALARRMIRKTEIAPSQLSNPQLCYQALTGDIGWRVLSNPVPVKSVPVVEFSMSIVETLQKMSSTVRGVSEVGLYPRVSCIFEFIEL